MIDLPNLLLAETSTGALQSAWAFMQKGGLFMVPLAITSVVGMMAILYKFLSLSNSRVIPPTLAREIGDFERHIAADRAEPILAEIANGRSTLARLAAVVVKHCGRPQQEIIQAVEATSREEAAQLHSGIGILDIVITVAPLLGLLGTASGLVAIFEGLGDTTDHLAVARGIATALNTTIFGLSIAVPCVIAHGYFTRRIDLISARLESLLSELAHVCQGSKPQA